MYKCPECDFWQSVGADRCRRCDGYLAPLEREDRGQPKDPRTERWSVAQQEKRCIACWSDRSPWAWLTWWRCGKCRSYHCAACRDRYLSGGWLENVWTCQHCGHVERRTYYGGW
jgi:hypothetical protein